MHGTVWWQKNSALISHLPGSDQQLSNKRCYFLWKMKQNLNTNSLLSIIDCNRHTNCSCWVLLNATGTPVCLCIAFSMENENGFRSADDFIMLTFSVVFIFWGESVLVNFWKTHFLYENVSWHDIIATETIETKIFSSNSPPKKKWK